MPNIKQVKFLIFDWDGVFINAFELHARTYYEALCHYGITCMSQEELLLKRSLSTRDKLQCGLDRSRRTNVTLDQLIKEKEKRYTQEVNEKLLFPQTKKVITELKKKYTLGIHTNTTKAMIHKILNQGLGKQFAVVVTSQDLQKPKPAAEGVLLAMKKTGFKPEETAVIGDSIGDIESGKNAHVHACIGITTGDDDEKKLKQAGADYVVKNLDEVIKLLR